jgi:1,4-dihydroxy-2-naphthoate octaprenyltransferase
MRSRARRGDSAAPAPPAAPRAAPAAWETRTGAARTALAWLSATRPRSLTAAVAPFLVGSALGVSSEGGAANWAHASLLLLAYLLIQIGTNLVNDACDFERGADRDDRVGPRRVTQSGVFAPRLVRRAGVACFLLAAVAMLPPIRAQGRPLLMLLLSACAAGYLYTGGPYPYGYRGGGDLAVIAMFGVVAVAGAARVHRVAPPFDDTAVAAGVDPSTSATPAPFLTDPATLTAGAQVGSLAAVLLAVNNLRDVDTDRRAGKRTLAVLLGEGFVRREIYALLLAPFLANAWWARRFVLADARGEGGGGGGMDVGGGGGGGRGRGGGIVVVVVLGGAVRTRLDGGGAADARRAVGARRRARRRSDADAVAGVQRHPRQGGGGALQLRRLTRGGNTLRFFLASAARFREAR